VGISVSFVSWNKTPPNRGLVRKGSHTVNDEPGDQDRGIIERTLLQDRRALEDLLLLRYDWLRIVAANAIPQGFANRVLPEDVVHEAFVKILRNFGKFRPETEAGLFAWMRVVVQNTAIDMVRKAGATKESIPGNRGDGACDESVSEIVASLAVTDDQRASEMACRNELTSAFHAAMRELDPKLRRVIELLYFDDFSVSDAAEVMGITPDAVRGLRQRARQQIKDSIVRISFFV
jgi:RNA polymerase sigma-70 factor (ECF subfamily)